LTSCTKSVRLGIRSYLEASGPGKGLYEKFGYKKITEMIFDMKPFGHDAVDIHTVCCVPLCFFQS
jgi:hypothetical protein